MSPYTVVALTGLALLVTLLVRVPVAFALLGSGVLGVLLLQGTSNASSVLASLPFEVNATYVYTIIPMFIALGVFARQGGLAESGFAFAARALRRVPGGLAVSAVAACAGFAAVSGSSVATVVTLGPIATQEMVRHGYNRVIAAGVVGAAGTLGVMIPPSIVLVIYGILTGESIGALLLAGILPGLMTAVFYGAGLIIRAVRNPELMGGGRADSSGPIEAIDFRWLNLVKLTILFGLVIGTIYTGVATATEAAALAAACALVFYARDLRLLPRHMRLPNVVASVGEAARMTSMTMALLLGGSAFSYFLVIAGVPRDFAQWLGGLELPRLILLLMILAAFVVLGMFIDGLSILLIAVPLTYPAVIELGYDGIWFGIIVVKAIEIGLITPPFGLNAFVVAGTTPGLSVTEAFKGVLWYLPLEFAVVATLIAIPDIATWLPSLAGANATG